MCGIAGILATNAAEHSDAVQRMLRAVAHRGPDGSGQWASPSGRCLLGHRRLAILDLTAGAAQPMLTPTERFALSYNGECYNFRELRAKLTSAGETIHSSGDTEVVLHCLAQRGDVALTELNGMFALAFWDEQAGRLLLARDRFGQKPLYWIRFRDGVLFASEVRALLASGLVPRRLNPSALRSFLCHGSVQGPETLVADVQLLPRACALDCRLGREPKESIYWQPSRNKYPASTDELREVFLQAVQRHLISDVPTGVFLSGGVDSSAIAAAAGRAASGGVTSLAVVFPEQPEQSEAQYSRLVAQSAGTRHIEVPVADRDMLAMLDESLAAQDQPSIDGVNTYIVSKAARQAGLTVALSGIGGDELFGGYSSFEGTPRLLRMRRLLEPVRQPLGWLLRRGQLFDRRRSKIGDLLAAPRKLSAAYVVRRRLFSSHQVRALLPRTAGPGWLSGLPSQREAELDSLAAESDPADAIGNLELECYMGQTLLRDSDVMGMACSLEIRAPFLDKDFANLVLTQSASTRHRRHVRKWRLIEALGDLLPDVTWRRRKQGFTLPFETWLLRSLRERVGQELSTLTTCCSLFAGQRVQQLWDDFVHNPAAIGWSRPWALFLLGAYLNQHKLTY
jgi:asparagine synthase (glutamine-hydrolysing)